MTYIRMYYSFKTGKTRLTAGHEQSQENRQEKNWKNNQTMYEEKNESNCDQTGKQKVSPNKVKSANF